jgi:hypothetical protein
MPTKLAYMLVPMVLLGALAGCSDEVVHEPPRVAPQGKWSSWEQSGDISILHRFEFMADGAVVHRIDRCVGSDTGESPASFSSQESLDASWSFGPGDEIHVHGLDALSWSNLEGTVILRPSPADCRALSFSIVVPDWPEEIEMPDLEYADLCFNEFGCSPTHVTECSETPEDGCPGD